LFKLADGDPPYLAPWCNGLVHMLTQIQTIDAAVAQAMADQGEVDDGLFETYKQLERGVFYYAGLIAQCTEPCGGNNKKLNSTTIVWQICQMFVNDKNRAALALLSAISTDISRHDNRRELPFLVMTLLTLTRVCVASDADTLEAIAENEANHPLDMQAVQAEWS
jgi:hypothetical protein